MFTRLPRTIALAASLLAIPAVSSPMESGLAAQQRRQHSNAWANWQVTLDGPTGHTGQVFQMTVDGGVSWQDKARNTLVGPQKAIGLRVKGIEESAVFAKNVLPEGDVHWMEYYSPEEPYNFGIAHNNVDIHVDFSKRPDQSIRPGETIPIVLSADFDIFKDSFCPVDTWSVTVNYVNGTSPSVYSTHDTSKGSSIQFHIDDASHIANVTTSLGAIMFPGPPQPLAAQYASVDAAPLVTANMVVAGGFCDWDD